MSRGLPLVYAVVLNWNKTQDTADCIISISQQDYNNVHIIVVDNGSVEESLRPLDGLSTPFLLVRNTENLGFAGGVNVGISRALNDGADYVWLVNNDAVPNADALSHLVNAMNSDARIGLSSPMILNADAENEVEFCGGVWDKNVFHTTNNISTYGQWLESFPDQIWLVGTALLLSRSVIQAVGLFNEKLFAYWEDNDFSVRSLRAGFRNVVVVESIVRHWSGKPKSEPGLKPTHYHYYMARNEILFILENISFLKRFRPLLWAVERQLRQVNRMDAFPGAIDSIASGLWDGLRGRGGAYAKRRRFSPAISLFLRNVARMYDGRR